jgi:hypothetical protein
MRLKPLIFLSFAFTLVALIVVMAISHAFLSVGPSSPSSTRVFVDPPKVQDETLQAGSTFTVNLNVSDVDDLFAWQVSLSWNSSILNVTSVTFGDFLAAGTTSPNGTSTAWKMDNVTGYVLLGETTLGDYSGVNGNGTLASVEFEVLAYGDTVLNISSAQSPRTVQLDQMLLDIAFTPEDGYFSNVILGDFDSDRDVDPDDFSVFAGAYGSGIGDPEYDSRCDFDEDADVDPDDFSVFAGNYGKTV